MFGIEVEQEIIEVIEETGGIILYDKNGNEIKMSIA